MVRVRGHADRTGRGLERGLDDGDFSRDKGGCMRPGPGSGLPNREAADCTHFGMRRLLLVDVARGACFISLPNPDPRPQLDHQNEICASDASTLCVPCTLLAWAGPQPPSFKNKKEKTVISSPGRLLRHQPGT